MDHCLSNEAPEGTESRLESAKHPAVRPSRTAMVEDGIPVPASQSIMSKRSTRVSSQEVCGSFSRQQTSGPLLPQSSTTSCGNSIQIAEMKDQS